MSYNTIAIRGFEQRDEAIAAAADIQPGMLLGFNSSGVIKHGVAAGPLAPVAVALESPTAKASSTGVIDTLYANGDTVYIGHPKAGDVGYLLLAHSTGNTAVEGVSQLVSNGAGLVKVYALSTGVTDGVLVGTADESVDNSAGTAAVRLRVKFA